MENHGFPIFTGKTAISVVQRSAGSQLASSDLVAGSWLSPCSRHLFRDRRQFEINSPEHVEIALNWMHTGISSYAPLIKNTLRGIIRFILNYQLDYGHFHVPRHAARLLHSRLHTYPDDLRSDPRTSSKTPGTKCGSDWMRKDGKGQLSMDVNRIRTTID
jgi:hypothetical protein